MWRSQESNQRESPWTPHGDIIKIYKALTADSCDGRVVFGREDGGEAVIPIDLQTFFEKFAGRLKNVEILGEGSFGSVFRAEDAEYGKACIVKVYHRGQPEFLRQYTDHLLEISASASGIAPSSLVLPHHKGEVEGIFYQIFEYIPSPTSGLQEEIDKGDSRWWKLLKYCVKWQRGSNIYTPMELSTQT